MSPAVSHETAPKDAPLILRALETKALRAAFWSILEYGSGTGLRVVSSLVLTRLLLPAYFGEMTLVMTLIVGINLLSDIGLAPSVIQSPRGDDPLFLNTAWTLHAIRGVGLWVISVAISWPMALYYHDPRLRILLPVLAISTLLSGFNSTNLLTLSRHMGVRRLFAIDGSTSLVSLIVTIAWAYKWPSVWSIVGGQLAGSVYRLCLSHIPSVAPGIRNSFGWDKSSIDGIVHFGKWILVGTAFFFFASQADRLVLGHLVSLTILGIYGLAYSLSEIPRQVIVALGSRVAYPFIAKIIHLPLEEFRKRFFQYRFFVLLIGAGLLSLMVVWGHLLILKLYDVRYHEASWMIPILAVGLWHTLLYQTTAPVLFSLGKPKYNATGNAAYCVFIIVAIRVAFHFYGLLGAVIAIAAGDFPLYLVILFGATRERIRPLRQDILLTGIFIALMTCCFLLERFVPWLHH
jgi:O-antigen/teichoic acid export membrane protein